MIPICEQEAKMMLLLSQIEGVTEAEVLKLNCREKGNKPKCMVFVNYYIEFLKLLDVMVREKLVSEEKICDGFKIFSGNLEFCLIRNKNQKKGKKNLNEFVDYCLENPNLPICLNMFVLGNAIQDKLIKLAKTSCRPCRSHSGNCRDKNYLCDMTTLIDYKKYCNDFAVRAQAAFYDTRFREDESKVFQYCQRHNKAMKKGMIN